MRTARGTITLMGVSIPLVFAAGLFVWDVLLGGSVDWILGLVVLTIASIAFFGTLAAADPSGGLPTDGGPLRTAITVSVVAVYFAVLAIALFIVGPDETGPLTDTLVSSFTGVVGVVIAFYFGASAYVQVQSLRANRGEDGTTPSPRSGPPR